MTDRNDEPLITLDNAVLRYSHAGEFGNVEETVLDMTGQTLEVRPGDVVGLHAGGEGTFRHYHELALWLQGFKTPYSGRMTLFGAEPPLGRELVAKTARIFREGGVLPDFTVHGNIELALAYSGLGRREAARRVEEAMERFDLVSYRNFYPGTDDVGLGAEKRLNYARAWARRPLILCVDQPFLHIRDSYADEAVDALNALAAGGGAIVFTTNQAHDLWPGLGGLSVWNPTRRFALDWGRLTEIPASAEPDTCRDENDVEGL